DDLALFADHPAAQAQLAVFADDERRQGQLHDPAVAADAGQGYRPEIGPLGIQVAVAVGDDEAVLHVGAEVVRQDGVHLHPGQHGVGGIGKLFSGRRVDAGEQDRVNHGARRHIVLADRQLLVRYLDDSGWSRTPLNRTLLLTGCRTDVSDL